MGKRGRRVKLAKGRKHPPVVRRRKRGGKSTLSPEKQIENATRRNKVLELRLAGHSPDEIARQLDITKEKVYRDYSIALDTLAEQYSEDRSVVVHKELARLDILWARAYEEAVTTGNNKAIEVCLKIMERRARMLALDAPPQKQGTATDQFVINVNMGEETKQVIELADQKGITLDGQQ